MASDLNERYPKMATLFGAYFHQDFDFDYGSPRQTIEAFVTDCRPSSSSDLLLEISTLLQNSTDVEIARALAILGNEFSYETDGFSARQWLERVAEIVEELIGSSSRLEARRNGAVSDS